MLRLSGLLKARPAVGLALAGAIAGCLTVATPAFAENISVIVDRAKVMRISRPADVVIIGNSAIADATIQDNQTLIITGRSFGTTNLIILDSAGNELTSANVTVSPQNDQMVTVYRRAERTTFSCAPDCAPVIAVGDSAASFDAITQQVQAAAGITSSAAQK